MRTVRTGSHAPGNHSNELEHLQDKVFSFSINLKAYHLYYMEYLLRKKFIKNLSNYPAARMISTHGVDG